MPVKAVIWDLAGVLLLTIRGSFNSMLAERLGVPEKDVERVIYSPQNALWDLGEMSDDEFYDFMLGTLGLPPEKKAAIESFVIDDFYIDPPLLDYIRALRARVTTVLLTNFPAHVHDHFRKAWFIDGAFDHVIASCDVKLLKPDPRMYALALQRAGCRAEEAVFIDDRAVNVEGARDLGLQAVLYETREQAMRAVDALLSD